MSNYTSLGEWSDSEDDELIRNINEDEVLRKFNDDEWDNSEDDEWIRNINEDEILPCVNDEHTGRGEKRKTLSDSEDEPITKRKNVVSSHTDPIPSDELIPDTSEENEQTGRGKKRKAENQDVEQEQEYYHIQPVKDYHSKKFNMTAKNYRVQFNNTLDNVDLLQSQNRT